MFSTRVSAVGLARGLQATIPHTAPASGVSPFHAERQYQNFKSSPESYARTPAASTSLLSSSGLSATVNAFGNHQVRYAHTDVSCPDFSPHRRETTMDPHAPASESKYQRRALTCGLTALATIPGLYLGKSVVKGYLGIYAPDAFAKVMSKVEVDLSAIQRGFGLTVMWQGKPLFIRRRTEEEIAELNAVNVSELRDPQQDADRFVNQEWTVVVGICTHLGCVPISHAGDFNGFYCPCHSSHYDIGGRVRKGPAPLNLRVPTHMFPEDGTLVVG